MVAILMSTYNGERYLREQIDSLLNQTYKDWKLYIRDDKSTDGTVSIIEGYVRVYPDQIVYKSDGFGNLGAGCSFMQLLSSIDSDYYMFCDQDDVWMEDKIERTYLYLRSLEQKYSENTAIGVFTDLTFINSNLTVLMPSLWKGDNRNPDFVHNFYKQWTNRHASYGCTQMFNHAAKKLVLPYRQFEGTMGAHDNWVEYILIKKGVYDYIDESTILYRQHGTNVVGANFGHSYKDDLNEIFHNPILCWRKIVKDYKRMKIMPFHVSLSKVLWYRFYQSIEAVLKKSLRVNLDLFI